MKLVSSRARQTIRTLKYRGVDAPKRVTQCIDLSALYRISDIQWTHTPYI